MSATNPKHYTRLKPEPIDVISSIYLDRHRGAEAAMSLAGIDVQLSPIFDSFFGMRLFHVPDFTTMEIVPLLHPLRRAPAPPRTRPVILAHPFAFVADPREGHAGPIDVAAWSTSWAVERAAIAIAATYRPEGIS